MNSLVGRDPSIVADDAGGLQIIDVTNPLVPAFVGSYNPGGYVYSVAVTGHYAFLTDYFRLRVLDISSPESPTLLGSYDAPARAWSVPVAGCHAYVTDYCGLLVLDVSGCLAAGTETDDDCIPDGFDNCPATYNPLQTDADQDGVDDACDACTDADSDGFGNPSLPLPRRSCPSAL